MPTVHGFLSRRQEFRLATVVLIVVGLLIAALGLIFFASAPKGDIGVFVGLDIGYGDEGTARLLIDKVASYVNLVVLGSLELTTNTEALTRVCDYLYQKNLFFIVYVGLWRGTDLTPRGPDANFFTMAAERWGDKFLGVYLFDEVGGKLVDGGHSVDLTDAQTYSEAAFQYNSQLSFYLKNMAGFYAPAQFRLFSSDYALYWYDYVAGYDVIFAEYVENQSRQIATGLCRGAAKSLGKEWGVMITWSVQEESFVENPDQLYHDMVLAYQNGAKYILVFNSIDNSTSRSQPCGVLTPEHFEKMQQFWDYARTNPAVEQYSATTAFVIPKDYGFGFRRSDDKIWGKWESDHLSPTLWTYANHLLSMYVICLDIVFETRIADMPIDLPYRKLIFWNSTIIEK